MTPSKVLLMLMRISAVVQVVLGIGFWTGHWYGLVHVHRANGIGYVVILWVLAIVALIQRREVGVALFAAVWGVVIAMLGFTQQAILAGSSLHWVVRVLHLLVSLSALGLAERLAGREGRREVSPNAPRHRDRRAHQDRSFSGAAARRR